MNFFRTAQPTSPSPMHHTSSLDRSTASGSTRSTNSYTSDITTTSSTGQYEYQADMVDQEKNGSRNEDKIYVAVTKDSKEWKANLLWVLQNMARMKKIVVLHIHRPAKTIPLMGGYFPADQLNDNEVAAFRKVETQKMNQTIAKYLAMCSRVKVKAEKLIMEMDDIAEGIVTLIAQHGITELVIGAAADKNYSKKLKVPTSNTAISVQQQADQTCKIWFICKGNVICTREAVTNGYSVHQQSHLASSGSISSQRSNETPKSHHKHPLSSFLSNASITTGSRTTSFDSRIEESIPVQSSLVIDLWDGARKKGTEDQSDNGSLRSESTRSMRNVIQSGNTTPIYAKRPMPDPTQFSNLNHYVARATDAFYQREAQVQIKVRHISNATGIEDIRRERDEMYDELQKSHEQRAQLELQLINSNRIIKDLQEKLSEAHCMLFSLEKEQEQLRQDKDNAKREVQQLHDKIRELENTSNGGENFSEFTYAELQEATDNFDEKFKIGEGGYGSVYRGVIRSTTVAIKLLNPEGMQGQSEFHKEMDVLSKVRHPNLVTLVGACPEAWALVYEFLPNGSLEDRLSRKDNTPPLTWQARCRIAAEICSALVFLHTHKPLTVIHGDLKPANILLDGNFVSRLGDFGICRLLESNANTILFRCTHPMGTFVYMDPEFLASGELRPCSDVYSFGIILLRLLTGRQAMGIINQVHDAIDKERFEEIIDKTAGEWPSELAKELAELGLKCCEVKRKSRPDLETEAWKILEPLMLTS
ncbi:hypothetical protein LUZ60_006946 [Juncus effusus]|nr:hypothetical protein LUZ60_006946 [Juncus effusus]